MKTRMASPSIVLLLLYCIASSAALLIVRTPSGTPTFAPSTLPAEFCPLASSCHDPRIVLPTPEFITGGPQPEGVDAGMLVHLALIGEDPRLAHTSFGCSSMPQSSTLFADLALENDADATDDMDS